MLRSLKENKENVTKINVFYNFVTLTKYGLILSHIVENLKTKVRCKMDASARHGINRTTKRMSMIF